MKMRILTFGIAVVVGLAGGYVIRAASSAGDSVEREPDVQGARVGSGGEAQGESGVANREGFNSYAQEKADLSKSAGVTKWLHWVASLETAGVDDMARLAGFAEGNSLAKEMLVARWVELDPEHLFDMASHAVVGSPIYKLQSDLMDMWLKKDMVTAVEALRKSDAPGFYRWRMSAVGDVIEHDAELGLTLFHEWQIESFRPHMTEVEKWARANPPHAAEFALARPAGAVTESAAEVIGRVWAESDPEAALAFCEGASGRFGHQMSQKVLEVWAQWDLSAAADWLGAASPMMHGQMAASFVGVWATEDSEAALAWSRENLSGHVLEGAVAASVGALVKTDRDGAANLVANLEPSKAKSAAAAEVLESWMPDWDERKPVPAAALDWMGRLDEESRKHVVQSASWRWVRNDPSGFAEYLARPDTPEASLQIVQSTAGAMAREDPKGAMEWAMSLPNAKDSVSAQVFYAWHRTQPEAAMTWLVASPEREKLIPPEALEGMKKPGQ